MSKKKMNWGPDEKWDEKQGRMKFSSVQFSHSGVSDSL